MPSEKPGEARRSDPSLSLIDTALHDGLIILDAYARFATTAIGAVLFPYAAMQPRAGAPGQNTAEPRLRSGHRGIAKVAIALLVGAVLGANCLRAAESARRVRTAPRFTFVKAGYSAPLRLCSNEALLLSRDHRRVAL
jgi:hypothetical protein